MNINQPEWKLKGRRCPCACGGAGFLILIACPACGAVLLLCDEIGTVQPAPRALNPRSSLAIHQQADHCPRCQSAPLAAFAPANSDQIQAAGFAVGEYE